MQRICYAPLQLFSLFFDAFLKNAIGLDSIQTVEFIFLTSEKKKNCDFFLHNQEKSLYSSFEKASVPPVGNKLAFSPILYI